MFELTKFLQQFQRYASPRHEHRAKQLELYRLVSWQWTEWQGKRYGIGVLSRCCFVNGDGFGIGEVGWNLSRIRSGADT